MKIAVPLQDGRLSMHFGHCKEFAITEVDPDAKTVLRTETDTPPGWEPGALPAWLEELGVDVLIASGIGMRAQQLLADKGITVVIGAPDETPDALVHRYLDGSLETGQNICDH